MTKKKNLTSGNRTSPVGGQLGALVVHQEVLQDLGDVLADHVVDGAAFGGGASGRVVGGSQVVAHDEGVQGGDVAEEGWLVDPEGAGRGGGDGQAGFEEGCKGSTEFKKCILKSIP